MVLSVVIAGCGNDAGSEAQAPLALGDIALELTSIGDFDQPIDIVPRPNDTALYVAGKEGTVTKVDVSGSGANRTYKAAGTVLDIKSKVVGGGERGFLGIAFSPDGKRLYAMYTAAPDGANTVTSYAFDGSKADPGSAKEILSIDDFAENHNGGHLEFGPDGFLYVGTGDGGGGGDPKGNGQNRQALLGKILRLDPEHATGGKAYAIPTDNPFADGKDGRPEVWAYGLRNPWRFSFDRQTKDLWIGDVGQESWEEVDMLPASGGGGKGANLGWNKVEGSHPYQGGTKPAGAVDPVYEYKNHDKGACAVTGGVVYRGPIKDLQGAYLFGDSCQNHLRGIRLQGAKVGEDQSWEDLKVSQLVSFGQDTGGDVYVVDLGAGKVFRLDGPASDQPPGTTAPPASSSTTAPSTTAPATTQTTTGSTTTAPPATGDTIAGPPGGLRAEYFSKADLTGKTHVRTEPRVYLDYEHAPFEDFAEDGWSVRWTGEVRVDKAGDYTLTVTSDEGARLWVDGQPVVDAWAAHPVRDDAKQLTLTAGRHDLKLEYHDDAGVAFAKLSWAGPDLPREVIPGPNLYPAAG